MKLFRRKPSTSDPAAAPPSISAEADLRRAIHEGAERRRERPSFSVLCVKPQAVGKEPEIPPEIEAASRNIALELRTDDRFCRLEDGSYIVLLKNTNDDYASVVAQR